MVILCDTCSILMLIRIAPEMFIDPRYGTITIQSVAREFKRTQKFKTKYPWRQQYGSLVRSAPSSATQDQNFLMALSVVTQMLESGIINIKKQKLFDLSKVDQEVVSFGIAFSYLISTGDQGMIDFASQEFPDDFKGNISPLELIVVWLEKCLFEWDESRQRILEEWAVTNERPQPKKGIAAFKKITGRKYPGP